MGHTGLGGYWLEVGGDRGERERERRSLRLLVVVVYGRQAGRQKGRKAGRQEGRKAGRQEWGKGYEKLLRGMFVGSGSVGRCMEQLWKIGGNAHHASGFRFSS